MEEIEVKFLDIDKEALEKKLEEIGARKVGSYFYKRRIFDYPDLRLNSESSWLRLRDEGEKVTLSFKKRIGTTSDDGSTNDGGMQEIEIVVSDFDKTGDLLLALGFIEKFYQENKRERWVKDGVEFDIDTWPKLPTYLEIEAGSWEKIDETIEWLGLNPEDKKVFSTGQIYKMHGIRELDYQRMSFEGFVKKEHGTEDKS